MKRRSMTRYEKGDRNPKDERVRQIAKLLNVSFKDLETLIKIPNITVCCSLDETKNVLYNTYGQDIY